MWQVLRTIVEQPAVQKAADKYSAKFPRFDEAWEALKWLLARSGNTLGIWQNVGATQYRVYVQASDELALTPEIWVVFTCSDDEVVIHGLEAREPDTKH